MILYIVCIMSFVWRTGTTDDANRGQMTPEDALVFRILVSVVLSLGVIYFVLIASTLRKYGEMMDRAWHRRIMGWVNDIVASANYGNGHIPISPGPIVDPPIRVTTPSKYHPHIDPYPEPTHTPIRYGSISPMRSPGPHGEFSSFNHVRRHDHGTHNRNHVHGSQSVSKDEEMRSNGNASPRLALSPTVPVPTPAHPLHLPRAIPDEGYHRIVINPNLPQEPIKLVKLLSLSFEGDHPLEVPPSEDELNACHMTKDLWNELQTVSPISISNTPLSIQQ